MTSVCIDMEKHLLCNSNKAGHTTTAIGYHCLKKCTYVGKTLEGHMQKDFVIISGCIYVCALQCF